MLFGSQPPHTCMHTLPDNTQTHTYTFLGRLCCSPSPPVHPPGGGIRPFPLMKLSVALTARSCSLLLSSLLFSLFKTLSLFNSSAILPLSSHLFSSYFSSQLILLVFYPSIKPLVLPPQQTARFVRLGFSAQKGPHHVMSTTQHPCEHMSAFLIFILRDSALKLWQLALRSRIRRLSSVSFCKRVFLCLSACVPVCSRPQHADLPPELNMYLSFCRGSCCCTGCFSTRL